MALRHGRKVVKFHKEYKIVIQGQTDTTLPEEEPMNLAVARKMLEAVVKSIDGYQKNLNVSLEEIKS